MLPLILLVDDEEEILEFLERILNSRYSILKAANGKEALKVLDAEAVQLVISDVMMPGMDGFELCRIIKSTIDHSHIPVILLTAKNTIQAKVEGLELGADIVGVAAARHGVERGLELKVVQLVGDHRPRGVGHHEASVVAEPRQARHQVKRGIEAAAALVLDRERRIF